MRILVSAIAQPDGISGVQRHAFNLVRCLLHLSEITSVHLALAPWQLRLPTLGGLEADGRLHIEIAKVTRGSVARNLWHLQTLPHLAHKVRADLVQLTYPVPFLRSTMPCPVVMTLHDLYPFQIPGNFGFPQVVVNQFVLRLSLRQADAISCVSHTTLRALQASDLCIAPFCTVVSNCVEAGPPSSSCGPLSGWNGETFLLTVAQHRRNKNLDLLFRTFARLLASGLLPRTARLVVVGMPGPETSKLHALSQTLGINSRVDLLEGLSDPELQWCYRHCAALVAPSSIEGFGLPVVEARIAGCRVVCSDIPAFREFAGPQVHFVNLHQGAEFNLHTAIADALGKPRPAPEVLPDFAVHAVADRYLKLYRTALTLGKQTARVPRDTGTFEKRPIQ